MNDLIRIATLEITRFLAAQLPGMSPNWWQKHVIDRLSFQQQRIVQERGHTSLPQLDLAALLRVLDQNWYELGGTLPLPREARTWLKELQTVRNKWAHMSGEALPASEVYRDADTLGRVLKILSSEPASLHAVEAAKVAALAAMTGHAANSITDAGNQKQSKPQTVMSDTAGSEPPPPAPSMFKVGDLIALRSDPGTLLPVIEVISGSVECRYRVFQNNAFATYYESQLQAAPATEDVRHQLSVRELHAHLTSLNVLSPSASNLFSLRLGRVQFIPYQYRPVLKLIRADRPRLLIADEVGVGKTIEAGLIIQELRARMDIASVLVICPKALVAERKWFTEMKRFDESFTALDGKLLRHCLRETHLEGEWPEKYSKAILPFSLFDSDLLFGLDRRGKKTDQGLLDLDPPPKFDLVIVDEAHHLRNAETLLHQSVRFFCDNASAVLLLTATPVQLGSEDLFTLLNVLRPDIVIDRPSFDQMAEPNRHINTAVQHCRAGRPLWQQKARACLDAIANTSWGQLFLRESPAFQSVYDRLGDDGLTDAARVQLVRAIEDLYTFSSLINRTRRRDIGEFTSRKPETLSVEFTEDQRRLHDDLLDVIATILTRCHGQQNVKFLMTTIRRQAASCLYGLAPLLSDILHGKLDLLEVMEAGDTDDETDLAFVDQVRADIEDILERARSLDARDPKVEAFLKVLIDKDKRPNNKALVFSTFRHTLSYLDARARQAGLRVGLVHGDVQDEDRADLRRRFALPREDGNAIDVLLSSEVGCEGLDFQFCDLLVNYDLPWNPMRIEQRIGRIDRFGQQSETVAIVNLITPGTVDADIYDRCLWRIGVFQHAVGASEEILGEITRELHDIAESFTLSEDERAQRLQQLSDNAIRIIQEEQDLETRQSELFGLSVPKQSWREEIEAAQSYWLAPAGLQGCVTAYLAARLSSEGSHVLGDKPLKTLRLGQEARDLLLADFKRLPRSLDPIARAWEKWLKGDKPTLSITFDQQVAAEIPKVVHLSVVHPLVRQAARHLEITEPKHVALVAVHPDIPAGTHPFALYRWSKHGVRQDEVLIAVAGDAHVEAALLPLLQTAADASPVRLLDAAQCEALDARHYEKWSAARADHIADNRQLVEQRIQSLTVSHRARCHAIQDQIARATNDKIRLMKQSELARANADFDRRVAELRQAAEGGDIRATPVVFGTFSVSENGGI